jgi:hypothetical protein
VRLEVSGPDEVTVQRPELLAGGERAHQLKVLVEGLLENAGISRLTLLCILGDLRSWFKPSPKKMFSKIQRFVALVSTKEN